MDQPTVSIIISVHNGGDTLVKALESIESQTFTDYEVLIVNDASTDNTQSLLRKWQSKFPPKKCILIDNSENIGLTKSLNKGIEKASGKFIARLDHDDTWDQEKLRKQINFFRSHPDHGIVGTWYTNHGKSKSKKVELPVSDKEIKRNIFRKNPFGHSCVVFKKTLWEKSGRYDERLRHGQDLDLWFRFLPLTKMANIPEILCHRQIHETVNKPLQMKTHIKTTMKYIRKYNAPLASYLYLIEPLLVMLTPKRIRQALRS